MKVVILVGTNRAGSLSSTMADAVLKIYLRKNVECKVLELSNLPPETFSPTSYVEKPSEVVEFTNNVLNSTGLIVVTPEYNGSMAGALKLFIDLLPFPESFENRPICYIGISSGQSGALRPVEHLQQVFGYRNAFNYPRRVFVPLVHESVDKNKGILDPELLSRLELQASGFVKFCRSLEGFSSSS